MAEDDSQSDDFWRKKLTPEQFEVCRKKGTEQPFTGQYWNCKDEGVYRCICCSAALFGSDSKYDSGTGWPSFLQPLRPESVKYSSDQSFFMTRTEVACGRCGAHLGHVFNDGPMPAGKRFCLNSAALQLAPKEEKR